MSKYSLLLNVKKVAVYFLPGLSMMSQVSIGWVACVALCCMQMGYVFTKPDVSALMSGQ